MTTLILTLHTPDGRRAFEVVAAFENEIKLAESCLELIGDRREWRDSRYVLLLVGRKPGAPA